MGGANIGFFQSIVEWFQDICSDFAYLTHVIFGDGTILGDLGISLFSLITIGGLVTFLGLAVVKWFL